MTGRCTRWQRWLPGSGGGLRVLNLNLHSFQLLDIIQVLDSISWVRCASGNVLISLPPRLSNCALRIIFHMIFLCIWVVRVNLWDRGHNFRWLWINPSPRVTWKIGGRIRDLQRQRHHRAPHLTFTLHRFLPRTPGGIQFQFMASTWIHGFQRFQESSAQLYPLYSKQTLSTL